VFVLKHAQGLFGLDAVVVRTLRLAGRHFQLPNMGDVEFQNKVPGIVAQRILFVGVPILYEFGYREIRQFAQRALASIAKTAPETKHVMLTVHGPGYGLDEIEAFSAEIAGLVDAVAADEYPDELRTLTIIEFDRNRANRLQSALENLLENGIIKRGASEASQMIDGADSLQTAGISSETKPRVFVAMPFKEEMDDTYH
jgi:hypothetical protein